MIAKVTQMAITALVFSPFDLTAAPVSESWVATT